MLKFLTTLIILFTATSYARMLNCTVHQDIWTSDILHVSLPIDIKPIGKQTEKTTKVSKKIPLTINGDEGMLYLSASASWYKNYKLGVSLNNMMDTFPRLNVSAFFYKDKQTAPHPGPDYIAMATDSVPGFNYYQNSIRDPKYQMHVYNSYPQGFWMTCNVLD